MMLSRYRLLYIHVPKSAGNSLSHLLMPHSDDEMTVSGFQDGWDRFELRGAVSRGKHMDLAGYRDALGAERLAEFRVATVARDPLDRAISHYFSPHRWMIEEHGAWRLRSIEWSIEDFRHFIGKTKRMVDFFAVEGAVRMPDHIIRFEDLRRDLIALERTVGLPLDVATLPHVNRSAADDAVRTRAYRDKTVRRLVSERFAQDFERFGYPLPV